MRREQGGRRLLISDCVPGFETIDGLILQKLSHAVQENSLSKPAAVEPPTVDPTPDHRIRLREILRARSVIDATFLNSPQYECEPLSQSLGSRLTLKVETLNPIRSFKGRGADFLIHGLKDQALLRREPIVGASAGNWGQALAWSCRAAGLSLVLYASVNANPLKVERMRALGAEVRLEGIDFDAAKIAAKNFAATSGLRMVADGLDVAASEGAGTMAVELLARGAVYDAVLVPLGNGAMLTGIARWFKAASPATKIYGVCATGADAMEKSWRSGSIVNPPGIQTIADGIGVRVPIPEAVSDMNGLVDDVLLVEDITIVDAMRLLHREAGLVTEPSGAAGVAGLMRHRDQFRGLRTATIICGSNVTQAQMEQWL
jgi:threonine dehydratase